MSPPDPNSAERSTVATPPLIERPSSRVPSGTSVYIAGLAPSSRALGPARRARIAAVATAWVCGISRRTGARPALPVKLPRKK